MKSNNFTKIDWFGGGYFDLFDLSLCEGNRGNDSFSIFLSAFRGAVDGDYSLLPSLINIVVEECPSPVGAACVDLLGNSAPFKMIEDMKNDSRFIDDVELNYSLMRILAMRGTIQDATVILESFISNNKLSDYSEVYPIWISQILDWSSMSRLRPEYYDTVTNYSNAVIERASSLKKTYRSDTVSLIGGELLHANKMCEFIRMAIESGNFSYILRQKFEAYAGVDCTKFYFQRKVSDLDAIQIIEEYLDSDLFLDYVPGERYFFGKRVDKNG